MFARILALTLVMACAAAPAIAQQSSLTDSASPLPPGITVSGSGSVPVGSWLAVVTFSNTAAKTPSSASIAFTQSATQHFTKAVEALGITQENIIVVPDAEPSGLTRLMQPNSAPTAQVRVTAPLAMLEKIRTLAKQGNVGSESSLQMTPADGEVLFEQAEALAVKQARAKAEAIAAADHQHVGRLINFTPSQFDLIKDAAAGASGGMLGAMFGNTSNGMVTASGLATFQLIP
ncbi:MAG TPA: SIMPL domain-containing protein [Candidatus Baltobacteraceae bacterium]|nr:SIMPL domain-containing protein [Candidatus Baltobacteraceae bacterium]